jgi:hypothetical protein
VRRRLGRRAAATIVVAGLLAAVLAVIGLIGPRWSDVGAARCLPARLQASPQSVAPGETLTVTSPAADCALGYGRGHTYTVTLVHRDLHEAPMRTAVAQDGSFRLTLAVPTDFPSGPAAVIVHGSPMDDCDDTGSSCAGYAAYVTVR